MTQIDYGTAKPSWTDSCYSSNPTFHPASSTTIILNLPKSSSCTIRIARQI
jgi:hypothetical protein